MIAKFKLDKIEPLVLDALGKVRFISGRTFYKFISKKIDEYENCASLVIENELERLTEEGKIVKYSMNHPKNDIVGRKINSYPEEYYTLFK